MKNLTTILIAAVVGISAAYITVQQTLPEDFKPAEKQESVYDRVMRTGKIRCGYTPWPPYRSVNDKTGELEGIDIDINEKLATLLELDFEYTEVMIGQEAQDLKNGKIDVMCGAGPWQLSSIKHLDFTTPKYYGPIYIYARADDNRFANKEDLNDPSVTFIAIDGDLSMDLTRRYFPQARMKTLPNIAQPSQLLLEVDMGKADVAIYDPQAAEGYIKNNPGRLKKLYPKPLAVYGLGYAVQKGDYQMLNLLNSAVAIITDLNLIEPVLREYDPSGNFLLSSDKRFVMAE